jgi:hypothetical protein
MQNYQPGYGCAFYFVTEKNHYSIFRSVYLDKYFRSVFQISISDQYFRSVIFEI